MKIEKKVRKDGTRIVLYGPEGVGKSTFGAQSGAVFLDVEDGSGYLDPAPQVVLPDGVWTWPAILEAIDLVLASPAPGIVIDTLDAVEPLIWAHVCERDKQANIEAYGYGKGYGVALVEWRKLLASLDRYRAAGKDVILLAHSVIRAFADPAGESFDRYELGTHKQAAALVKGWADFLLFAHYDQTTRKEGLKIKGIGGSRRVLSTERCAAWDAKTRTGIAPMLAMSYADFIAELKTDDIDALRTELTELAERVGDKAIQTWAEKNLKTASRAKIAEAVNRLRVRLGVEK